MEDFAMAIKYREDVDLEFLQKCDNDDLKVLADILIYGKNGSKRWTEELSEENDFKFCHRNYQKVWDLIAGELQLFGGDTIANIARRGHGRLYRDILIGVSKKMRVNFNKKSPIELIEMNLLMKIVEKALDKMSEDDKRKLAKEMKLKGGQFTTQAIIAALQAAIKAGRFKSYQIALIVANGVSKAILGRGLTFTGNQTLARMVSFFSGPIAVLVNIALFLPVITGPAYRVAIPATVRVAYMRQKMVSGNGSNGKVKKEKEKSEKIIPVKY